MIQNIYYLITILTSDVGRGMRRLQLDPAVCSRLDMATLARRLHSCTSLQHLDLGGAGEGTAIMLSYEEDKWDERREVS